MHFKEQGFAVGAILFAVVLMSIAAGALLLGSRGPSASAGDHATKVSAAVLMQQGANLRIGFDVMVARGMAPGNITFDAADGTGVFNPEAGGAQVQTPPASAQLSPDHWRYRTIRIAGVGTNSGMDHAVVVGSVLDTVCQQINLALYNTATIPVSGFTGMQWAGFGLLDMSNGVAGIDNRPEGCVAPTAMDGANTNIYYVVTAAQ
jgi:hypothetical protein